MATNYAGLGIEHHIVKVRKNGMAVELDDGSRWDIPAGDSTKAACWYETQRIIVDENEGDLYPFKLTNLDTAALDVVKANLRQ